MTALTDHTIDTDSCDGYGRCGAVPVWISAVHEGQRVDFFPTTTMGQYFKAANLDKKEVVCPWCMSGGAKLWEWAANPQGAIFTLLLRRSSGGGGGDYGSPPTQILSIEDDPKALAKAVTEGVSREGRPVLLPEDSIVGRWAGDRVVLIGDYDESQLWDELDAYRNISQQVVETWNDFIELEEMQVKHRLDCTCH